MYKVGDRVVSKICKNMTGKIIEIYGGIDAMIQHCSGIKLYVNLDFWCKITQEKQQMN